jgi:3-hydroxyisobutyrate dehydrogenase-like beta-hydroxyacid dehydrogenase
MTRRFLKKGARVTVWNRTAQKAHALANDGALVAGSAADAVSDADRVHIVLSDDRVVDDVLDEIVPALKAGAFVIDHSTTLPERTSVRAERMRANGVRFLHAPVFMSPQMATDGVGLMLVSGAPTDVAEVKTELDGMTGEVWYLGERPDLAANYKLFGNCMLFAISGGIADVIAMARGNAVDALEALALFAKFQPGNVISGRGPRMARGDASPPMFTVEMARKDVRLMIEAAKGIPLVVLPGVAKRMDELIAAGEAGLDIAAMAP